MAAPAPALNQPRQGAGWKDFTVYEPALFGALAQAVIAMLVALGLHLTPAATGAIEAVTTAAGGLIVAFNTRPFAVSALTGLLSAIGTLLIAYSVPHVTSGLISEVNMIVTALLAIVLRGHVWSKPLERARARQALSPGQG